MLRLKKLLSRKERDNASHSQPPNFPATVSEASPSPEGIEHGHNVEPLSDEREGLQESSRSESIAVGDDRREKYGLFRLRPSTFLAADAESGERNFLDIVAVHGITGDAYNTWEQGNSRWLQDLIPKEMPGVRVFSYGYPAEVFCTLNTGDLDTYARSLLEGLKSIRRSTEDKKRPIIFVCHSMGGIVVKKALIIAKIEDQFYDNIRTSVAGILFLGTPHRGSSQSQFPMVLASIANVALSGTSRFIGRMRTELIKTLEQDSLVLKDISTSFRNQTSKIKIASFIEQALTPPAKSRVVDDISGVMDIAGERIVPMQGCDHRSICRFADGSSEGYKAIMSVLLEWTEELNRYEDEKMTSDDWKCLQSFSFPELAYRRQDADQAYSQTCEWILQHSSYTTWVAKRSGLLWIKGKPGSGKSTIMAFIYRKYRENQLSKKEVNLHFFFHGRGTALQKTPIGMFRSLVHQLYQQVSSVRSTIRSSFLEKKAFGQAGTDWEWKDKELECLFTDALLLAAQSRVVSIFIDALDEAGSNIARQLAEYFHELNGKLLPLKGTAQIAISCRHYPILSLSLDIRVEDENYEDIRKYVNFKLLPEISKQDSAAFSAEDAEELVNNIVCQSQGVFQWARLVVPLIIDLHRQGESLAHIHEELRKVPSDLGEVYKHILTEVIEPRKWRRTLHLIQWICLAERPLSVTELWLAIRSDEDYTSDTNQHSKDFGSTDKNMEMLIVSLSGGLAEVRSYSNGTAVQFIHQSVNDFFRSDGLKYLATSAAKSQGAPNPGMMTGGIMGQSQDRLCKSCINYLQLEETLQMTRSIIYKWANKPEGATAIREEMVFGAYATRQWMSHAEKAEDFGVEQQHLLRELGSPPGPAFQNWITLYNGLLTEDSKCPQPGFTILHIASASNLLSVFEILKSDTNTSIVNQPDNTGSTPMHYAARWGHEDFIKLLFQAGGNWDVKDEKENTPLVCAAANAHHKIVKLLLEKGADIHERTGESGNALQAASLTGNKTLINILLDHGADVNAQAGEYNNALQAASRRGHEDIVKLLLKKGADVNLLGGRYGNALQAASARGHNVVKLLLEAGADVDVQGGHFGNALQSASANGKEDIVKLLLEAGADVNVQGGFFGNALQSASWNGHENIVKLLLEYGADVNLLGGYWSSALQAASAEGYEEIVKLFLEKGVDVNAQGGDYGNGLQVASISGRVNVVKLLLEKGADVNLQGGHLGNALQAASAQGYEDIVKLLLEKGADSNAPGGRYGNALQASSLSENKDVAKVLLENGADVNAQGGEYGNALQAALWHRKEATVKLFLEIGADVHAQGGRLGNVLQAASANGNEDLVNLVLEKGADVNALGGFYGNALQAASWRGHENIVKLLLKKGAEVDAQGGYFGNALQAASAQGYKDIVKLLLEKGAEVDARGGYFGNALQAASAQGYEDIVKLLLEKGEDFNAQGGEYGTALQAASANGHKNVVTILLEKKADVNTPGRNYGNALHAASVKENEGVVKLLVEKGADVNAQGGQYGNALQAASWKGSKSIMRFLLEMGADVNAQGGEYGNALQAASANGNKDLVKLLLENGAEVNAQGDEYGNALQVASANGNKDLVKLLLGNGAKVNARGGKFGNALQAASWGGNTGIVELLLEKEADVNAQGGQYGNALQAASWGGNKGIVKLLLEKGMEVNAQGGEYSNALQAASANGKKNIVKLLLEKRAKVNAQGGKYGNALQAAAWRGNKGIMDLLLETGAEVNAHGGKYGNALQAASANGNEYVVKLLLEKGAEVNVQGGEYGTALQAASASGKDHVVKLLLAKGGYANAQGDDHGSLLK